MLNVNISKIAIITVKNVDYRRIIKNLSKSEAINLLENSVLEKYCLKFQSIPDIYIYIFFTFFCFAIHKMVDSMDIYKSLNISIGTVMKNLEC